MTQELKSMRGQVSEFFSNDKGGVVTFTMKNQQIRAMFFQNCVFVNGKRMLVKDLTVGQVKKFLKVGDEVEFDCIPNPRMDNSYQIRWKCTTVWKGLRPSASQKGPTHPEVVAAPVVMPTPAPAPVAQRAPPPQKPAEPTAVPVGIVVSADGDEGAISIKRIGAPGEDFCRYSRRLCRDAEYMDVVHLTYHPLPKAVTVSSFKCTFDADRVIRDRSCFDYDDDELNRITGVVTTTAPAPAFKFVTTTTTANTSKGGPGCWTQVESKKSKSSAAVTHPAPPPPVAPTAPVVLPEEYRSKTMLISQVGCVKEDLGWKAVIEFSFEGLSQRALLLSKKYDPPVDTFVGLLSIGDLVDFDCHEYRRPDGTDNVTWFVSRAKKILDRGSAPEEEHPVVSLVGVTATVKIVDDVNQSGILELLAASPRGNKVFFEAKCVLVDKRPVSRDVPLSAQVSVGDVVKVNARPACDSDPLDFPWVAEKVTRETRYFSAAVSSSASGKIEVNNNKPATPAVNYAKIAEDLRELEDEINWDDEDDNKVEATAATNGDHRPADLHNPSPPVASPPMQQAEAPPAQPAPAPAPFFELPPVSSSLPESLRALMHAQYVQNRLIMALLQNCSLEVSMHAQATQNKLILGLLEACAIEAIHSHVPMIKQWMDSNPTLQYAVKEILTKRASQHHPAPPAPVYRERVGSGIDSTLAAMLLNSAQNPFAAHVGMDGPAGAGLSSLMNSMSSSTASSPANRFGTFSPFEPTRPGASVSPLAAAAAVLKNMGMNMHANVDPKAITGEVIIVRVIDETKGIAKFCDGGPHHGEEVEFSKQVCKFLGLQLPYSAPLSSVVRPEGRGTCRAVRTDSLSGTLWRAEELHIQ